MAYHHQGFWQPMDTLREKKDLEKDTTFLKFCGDLLPSPEVGTLNIEIMESASKLPGRHSKWSFISSKHRLDLRFV
jgi:hypothetical protein